MINRLLRKFDKKEKKNAAKNAGAQEQADENNAPDAAANAAPGPNYTEVNSQESESTEQPENNSADGE